MVSLGIAAPIAILIALAAIPAAARADITIAVAAPLTGAFQALGAEMKNGAAAAVADINATGGVLGEKLNLVTVDDACDARTAVIVAGQVVADHAAFVAGHLCSGASIAAAAIYAGAHVIQISPGATAAAYTDERAGPGTFRLSGRDDGQGSVAGAFLARTFAGKRVAFIDDKSAYGHGLATNALAAFEAAGQKATLAQSYDAGARTYDALATTLEAANVDAVFIGGAATDAGQITRALRDKAPAAAVVGGDTLASEDFFKAAGDASDGVIMTALPDPRSYPDNAGLVGNFRLRQIEPAGYTLYAYAAFQVWAQAAIAAGATDYDKVSAALSSGTFKTALGSVKFDSKGDASAPGFLLYVWKGGDYQPLPQ
jgi:branched-chain amino acid transport system substrate-binding protein